MLQTIAQALDWAREHIDRADARVILQHVLACDAAYLIAYGGAELDEPRLREFHALVGRRITGEPVAYLTGKREFYGLAFRINPAVLIPRPETELLVDAALEQIPVQGPSRVLDLGTGSGCVAITIAHLRPNAEVVATDASPEAVALARENVSSHGAENVELRAGDWFDPVRDERFAVIVANPPYVAAGDPHLMQGDLRFEPRAALAAGADGLDCIRAIVAAVPEHLDAGGLLALEHGYDQGDACRRLLKAAGFTRVATRRDVAGQERVTTGRHA
ncbi:MAG: peptide chain release factor N(5)-glutamine methyltransferase [Betaproteobacteria bacterium]|nr:peptide chain release factor N(5)-glutamine methyltransferase [Betaproteobacteria bacterium]